MSFQFEKYPNWSGIPTFLCSLGLSVSGLRKIRFNAYTTCRISTKNQFLKKPGLPLSTLIILDWYPYLFCTLIYCVISVGVSAVYAKYVSTPIHPIEFPQKNQFPKKQGFPLSTLIILDWYPYVSLFPDLLCNIGWSVSGLRKIRFNAYTPRPISTKNQFLNKPEFPLSTLIILDWYPYLFLYPDLLCNIGWSVSGLCKIRFNAHTPHPIYRKNQFLNKPEFPLSTLIILDWYPYVSFL